MTMFKMCGAGYTRSGFPTTGYEAAPGPEILWNENQETGNPKYRSEIWIPVKKKEI